MSSVSADAVDNFFRQYLTKNHSVLVDPGHGGKDPGAVGKNIYEKQVVLGISQYLQQMLSANNVRCNMTRKKDVFLSLKERKAVAEKLKPDLFVSIHADSHTKKSVRGTTVFVLSETAGNDSIAQYLVKEHTEKDELPVSRIISDLKFTHAVSLSENAAREILHNMGSLRILDRGVKRAPFAVLKNFSIPSILIEVGFISNPDDEKLLKTSAYQRKIAECIYRGIMDYLHNK